MVSVRRGSVALAVVILVLTQLMFVVDTSIVNVALPDIGRELGFSSVGLSWVVTAYALTFGGLILLSGKVGSMIGPRRALILGVTAFVIASIAGGLATSAGFMVAARALQGVGAAVAAPSVMVLLMGITTPGPQRSRAMAMFVFAVGAGAAVGLLAGGVLTQTLGWEWVMFVNAPIGVLVLFGAMRNLPEMERRRTSLDVGGAAASILAMVALVFAFTSAADRGWTSSSVLGAFTVAVLSLVVLIVCERRHPHPVMPLAFFSSMRSAGPLLSMLVIPAGQVGFLFFTTLLTQQVLGFTPIQTGLALVPFTLGLIATNQLTPRLLPRLGERVIGIAGLAWCWASPGWPWWPPMPARTPRSSPCFCPRSCSARARARPSHRSPPSSCTRPPPSTSALPPASTRDCSNSAAEWAWPFSPASWPPPAAWTTAWARPCWPPRPSRWPA
jgi:MFS family permease